MFWKRGLRKFVTLKQFKGNIYPNYSEIINSADLPQDGFTPGDDGLYLREEHRFGWIKCYSAFDKKTNQELAIIKKRIDGTTFQCVIKKAGHRIMFGTDGLTIHGKKFDIQKLKSSFEFNNIWC